MLRKVNKIQRKFTGFTFQKVNKIAKAKGKD